MAVLLGLLGLAVLAVVRVTVVLVLFFNLRDLIPTARHRVLRKLVFPLLLFGDLTGVAQLRLLELGREAIKVVLSALHPQESSTISVLVGFPPSRELVVIGNVRRRENLNLEHLSLDFSLHGLHCLSILRLLHV